jgi:hypothetical protein
LTLRFRDARSLAPVACRLQIEGPEGSPFGVADAELRTHKSWSLDPYVHVADSLVVELPAGIYEVTAVRGLAGIPAIETVDLQSDRALTLDLDFWIRPAESGWFGADPHVHLDHTLGAVYPVATPEFGTVVVEAEGLDLTWFLENLPDHPGGAVGAGASGFEVLWGEEYRSHFWGHMVLLGLDELVTSNGTGTGCCGWTFSAWPTLQRTLELHSVPLALLAHPHTTDDPLGGTTGWPGTGVAREAYALALGDHVDGMAVASGSTGPDPPWESFELYLDLLRTGARWSAVGEGDRPLNRFDVQPPGQPRTYAKVSGLQPGDPGFAEAWQNAVRSGRCFATTGPTLEVFDVQYIGMGGQVHVTGPGSQRVHMKFRSHAPLHHLRLHGATGTHLSLDWPMGRTELDTTLTVQIDTSDFFVLDVSGDEAWTGLAYRPRAVSSPIWVSMPEPWPVPTESARRAADALADYWEQSLVQRGYDSVADSLAAAEDILGAAAVYEAMADDPPADFSLTLPPEGEVLPTRGAVLRWNPSVSYDFEPVTYFVEVAEDPGFSDVVWTGSTSDTRIEFTAPAGAYYYWRVWASEPGESMVLATNSPRSFGTDQVVVAAPESTVTTMRLSVRSSAGGRVRLQLELPEAAEVGVTIYDLRGRRVRNLASARYPAGRSDLRWDGHDDAGRNVARGSYFVQAVSHGERSVVRVRF